MSQSKTSNNFFVNNCLYVIWCIIYFLLTWGFMTMVVFRMWLPKYYLMSLYERTWSMGAIYQESFLVSAMLYLVSLSIAFSNLGEAILRFVNRVRKLETKQEINYLGPIFSDVYKEAVKQYPKLKNVRPYIIDGMYINACALGRQTVAVTKGAIESLSEEELKGFIAHEFGHIAHGDTVALLLTTVGNGIFTVFVIITQTIVNILSSVLDKRGIVGFLTGLIRILLSIILVAFLYIGEVVLAINSRSNEYAADRFAFELGHGDDLVEALYLLQGMCISDKAKIVDRLKASHPHIAKRISRLEMMIDGKDKPLNSVLYR